MGIGDWGLGIGDWGLGPIPNPPSPIPPPPTPFEFFKINLIKYFYNKIIFQLFEYFIIYKKIKK